MLRVRLTVAAAAEENKDKKCWNTFSVSIPPNLGLFVCSVWLGCMARGPALPVITDLITYYLFYNLFFKTKTTTIICLKDQFFTIFFPSENKTADRSGIVLGSKCPQL